MKDLHGINISKLDSVEDMSRENQTSFLHSGVIKSCLDEDDDDDDVCVRAPFWLGVSTVRYFQVLMSHFSSTRNQTTHLMSVCAAIFTCLRDASSLFCV